MNYCGIFISHISEPEYPGQFPVDRKAPYVVYSKEYKEGATPLSIGFYSKQVEARKAYKKAVAERDKPCAK